MVGRTVSHYRVLELLGTGGMGTVYQAEDTRLGRQVALKFLPADLARDRHALDRFQREARAASALNHPHICTIHDIDEAEGQPFIAMELLEGQTLKERLQGRPLPTPEIVDLGLQLADALEAAHAKGIIHRDIKPANVFLTTRGTAKLLDFGLAKLAAEPHAASEAPTAAGDWVTGAGVALGTVGYMSPEQVRGEALDARTDLFSLGVVLYEMVTGTAPFRGATSGAVIGEILTKAPTAPVRLNPEVPADLERLVNKLLEKDRALRYQSAADLRVDLERLRRTLSAPAPARPEQTSIVVLPFENLSPDPDNAFFADGLTEELIADLSKVRALRVISRTSAMLLKGSKKDVPTIARELNVRYVLEGSVRRAGTSLRITAQLIDAAADAHLWAEKYSGTLDDVFAIQEKVSRAIVEALKLQLTPEEAERLADHPIPNALAFEFYLKARQEILKWTEAGLENALRYLQSGLEIAGPNAVLFAGLAYVYVWYSNLGLKDDDSCRREAESYLDRAFALEPGCPQGHFVLGLLCAFERPRESIRHLKHVLERNPNDFDALYFLSCMLGSLGQTQAAIPLEQRAARIDPLNAAGHFHLGFNRLWEGKFAQAREVLEKLNRSFPEDPTIKFAYGLSLGYVGEGERAGAVFDELAREQPGTVFAVLGVTLKYALEGKRAEALSCLEASPRVQRTRDFQYACWVAECYALIDEREVALEWLERDFDLGMINYPFLNEYDPFLANIRGEPRFRRLMARVKVEWERFQV